VVIEVQAGGSEGLSDGAREGGAGLGVGGAVAAIGPGVGAEEGGDEERGEGFDDPAGLVEAKHSARRDGGRGGIRGIGEARVGEGGHGSIGLCSASHAWIGSGAGFRKIQGLSAAAQRRGSVEITV
jgi:hypothetical protein